ncbi:MAG: UvrD-helicase domain-containing protein [Phycisphaerales bacterium]|nr:UvrD-helicase domain-containing protein [Phycisphaerales bacterium]
MSGRHSVILASAGSGKTYELAGRYIRLLAGGAAPERILALTFTRKAAGEMLARVFKRLMEAAASDEARRLLATELGRELSASDARVLALSLVRRVSAARVQTLDAFLTQSVRAVAPELGLPPKWRVMDESEQDAVTEDALDRVFDRLPLEQLMATVERLLGEMPLKPYEGVRKAVATLHGAWLECPLVDRWGLRPASSADAKQAAELAEQLVSLPKPQKKSGGDATGLVNALDSLRQFAQDQDWRRIVDARVAQASIDGTGKFGPVEIPAPHLALLTTLHRTASLLALHELAAESQAAGVIAAAFDGAISQAKQERGVVGFDDLARLLLDGGAAGEPEWMAFRLDSKIDHVLLDEFQDTSLSQYRCLEPILSEIASQESHRSIFAVGDVKQSLYGWRSAVPDLLPSLPERLHLGPASTRAKSWRSSPAVLAAVNAVFSGIAANEALSDYASAARRWSTFFQPHVAAKTDLAGEVRIEETGSAAADGSEAGTADKATEKDHIEQVADRVAELHEQHPDWSIAVLLRTTSDNRLTRYAEALKRRGIDAAEDRGFPLTAEPAVNAVLSLLQMIEHPGDSAAGYHVALTALGPIVGLRDPLSEAARRRCADALRSELAEYGLVALLRRVRLRLTASLPAPSVARLVEMERLASGFDANPGASLAEFVRSAQKGSVVDPSLATVSVMTIHRAKGLEFDAVILPELTRQWFKMTPKVVVDRGDAGETDPFAPVRCVSIYPAAELQAIDPELAAMVRRHRSRIVREELSCLYVAMTRAIRRLDVMLQPVANAGKQPSAARVLRQTPWGNAAASEGGLIARFMHDGSSEPSASKATSSQARSAEAALPERSPPREVTIRFAAAARPTRVAPSTKADQNLSDVLTFELTRGEHLLAGEVWHYAFETIEWRDAGSAARAAALAARRFRLADPDRITLESQLAASLSKPMGTLFDAARYATRGGEPRVLREWPFTTIAVESAPALNGRIDRLVVGTRGPDAAASWAEIVDYKVQVVEGDGTAAAEAHRPQLDAYRHAVAGLFKLDPAVVTCVLAFPLAGLAVELPGSNQSTVSADKRAGRNPKKS